MKMLPAILISTLLPVPFNKKRQIQSYKTTWMMDKSAVIQTTNLIIVFKGCIDFEGSKG